MHAFPWWFDFLMNALFVLLSWQTWVVIGGVAVGIFLWRRKNKKTVDCNAVSAKQLDN